MISGWNLEPKTVTRFFGEDCWPFMRRTDCTMVFDTRSIQSLTSLGLSVDTFAVALAVVLSMTDVFLIQSIDAGCLIYALVRSGRAFLLHVHF